ncbi:unnamed protein product [Didymodactylos carnosus]|uniref:Uncharacterized protein n=1 Tax=Didymodactylos carnosus TaxID=1234261 RepID=A0A814RSU3_9BILA|nr:unnamed protein product [Didymodactylos carnosus]CAF3901790.1 unnamed protein product [Didymodactylos carnosus]
MHRLHALYRFEHEKLNGSEGQRDTALKIVETCCQQLKNYDEQFLVLEKNLELQEKHMNSTNNTSMLLFEDDDYDDIKPNQSQLSTITSNNEQLQQQHDTSMETNSTTMLYGMSLATFISRDFSCINENESMIVNDDNPIISFNSSASINDDNNQPSEKKENKSNRRGDTIEDVLGDISESDQSSDDDTEKITSKKTLDSSSLATVLSADIFSSNETSSAKESHSKHRHHSQKHSKKRSSSKSIQHPVQSSLLNNVDDALQLSESEED